jgi:replicative DNA helicase
MVNDLIHLLLKTKSNFLKMEAHIKDHTLTREVLHVVATIREFRSSHPSQDEVTPQELQSFHHTTKAARLSSEQNQVFNEYLDTLAKQGPTRNVDEVLDYYMKIDTATQIANLAIDVGSGKDKASLEDIERVLSKYGSQRKAVFQDSDLYVTDDLSSLATRVSSPGLEWRLEELNVGAGPLRRGDMCLIAAAVESGKTTFLADQTSHMGTQMEEGETVLWCNNEEHSDKVKLRVYQAALGRTSADILSDLGKAKSDYLSLCKGEDRFRILQNNSAFNTTSFISRLTEDLRPRLVVFDQLDKVRGLDKKSQAEHERIGKLYNWARDLAMDQDLSVMAASQVDASGFDSKWIHMHQLRGSKVDKPGELDLLITIGKVTNDPNLELVRYIHLPKNKLWGGPRSDEKYRHGYWEVRINPTIARYEGIL